MRVARHGFQVKLTALSAGLILLLAIPACASGGGTAQSGGSNAQPNQEASGSAGSGSAASGSDAAPLRSGSGKDTQRGFDRKVVKTADLGIKSGDTRKSATEAQRISAEYGGSVLSSRTSRGDGAVSARLVLVVPSPKFEKALAALRKLGGEITTDTVKGEDVTGEYVDLKSRERNLLAAEKSLLKLYDKAKSVEDTLKVQNELTDIRGQIEQAQGRIQYLERNTSSSRISVNIQPVAGANASLANWDPARIVSRAWDASLAVLQTLATIILSAVVFGWWLAPLFIVAFLWWRLWRNRRATQQTNSSRTR